MKGVNKKWLPWLILIGGLAASGTLMLGKKEAKRKPAASQKFKLVRVIEAQPGPYAIQVTAPGTTIPAQEVNLAARVSGQVAWISASMVEGGLVEAGELLFKLDPADHLLALDQAKAALAKAEFDLDNVQAQKVSALQSLESLKQVEAQTGEAPLEVSSLALYGPQLKNAQASLASAQASVKQAQLHLERTEVRAPFSGYFRAVSLAVGQVITANQQVGKLFAERPIRIKLAVPLSDLPWIDLGTQGQPGSPARLEKQVGPDLHTWEGEVIHQIQEIDALGRMAQLMIEVDQPLSDKGFPLPLGLQVQVGLQGETLEQVYKVPLYALRSGNKVWLVGEGNKLDIRQVRVLRKEEGVALVESGLSPGELLIVSPLEAPVPGMPLKVYRPADGKDKGAANPTQPGAQL